MLGLCYQHVYPETAPTISYFNTLQYITRCPCRVSSHLSWPRSSRASVPLNTEHSSKREHFWLAWFISGAANLRRILYRQDKLIHLWQGVKSMRWTLSHSAASDWAVLAVQQQAELNKSTDNYQVASQTRSKRKAMFGVWVKSSQVKYFFLPFKRKRGCHTKNHQQPQKRYLHE